ncbi:MAG: TIGR02391 family protein [Acidobacteriota bacterium]
MPSRRRPAEPAPIEIKQFTPEEIERGIAKLKRRIDEVKALDPRQVRHDDQRVRNAEQNISTTILDVFGPNSPEYRDHKFQHIWHGPMYSGMPQAEIQQCFAAGLSHTITMLEGLIGRLEENRAELGQDAAARARGTFEGLDLHPRIATACADLYRDGHYSNAVLNASVALVNFVKEKSARHDLDGSALMLEVFSPNKPILAFNDLADQTDKDEQQGMMFLFAGAVLALRNPRAHKLLEDSPEEALEYIALLSLLAKRLDRAERRK